MKIDRRLLLKSASAGVIGVATVPPTLNSVGPMVSAGQDRDRAAGDSVFNLALAAYSFKSHFSYFKGKPQQPLNGKSIDMFDFIDYCAKEKCGAELTSYFFPPDADEAYFRKIKQHAFLNGVPIVGTAIGNHFTIEKSKQLDQQIADAKLWIDRAVQMGAPHVRFFAGSRKDLENSPDRMKNAIESLQECVDYAAKAGVFIGVENHGNLTADQVLKIVNAIDSEWFGINLDTGNFVIGDPYDELSKCAPHAINVQVKVKMRTESGEKYDSDLDRVARIFKDANYRGNIVLEYEEEQPFKNVPTAMKQLRASFVS